MPKNTEGIGMKVDITTQWQNIYTLTGYAAGSELTTKPDGQAVYIVIGGSQPTIIPTNGDAIQPFTDGFIPSGNASVWISTWPNTVTATVRQAKDAVLTDEHIPSGVFSGKSALTTQDIVNSAKKLGMVWEASRKITLAALPVKGLSIIKTGALPCILMERVLGCNGAGIIGRIYASPTYTNIGTEDPMYNLSTINPQPRLLKLYAAPVITNTGTKAGADIFVVSSISNQSQGVSPREFGSRRMLNANSEYLLEIESLESTATQQVTAEIVIIEGVLDLPI